MIAKLLPSVGVEYQTISLQQVINQSPVLTAQRLNMYNHHVVTHLRRLQGIAKIDGMWLDLRKVRKQLIHELEVCIDDTARQR